MKENKLEKLPISKINWENFIFLIGKANAEIARFDGIIRGIVNPHVLLSPLETKEAVLSSRIEGTQATLQEVMRYEAESRKEKAESEDIREILNYRKAIHYAVDDMKRKPLHLNLIKKIHNILMDSVRGKNKGRGEFRKVQNWIGKPGSTIEEAKYIPPPPNLVLEYLGNLENYINSKEKDIIVQLAIVHAQFEIIHPFLDGNGRVGRILIPLFLYQKELISSPVFYISEYLENNRDEYYYNLRKITDEGDWHSWIKFFLNAVINQAKVNIEKATKIINLYDTNKKIITEITHSEYVINIVDTIFSIPIFSSSSFKDISKIPSTTADRILNKLKENNIITTLSKGKGRNPTIYGFKDLLDIVK